MWINEISLTNKCIILKISFIIEYQVGIVNPNKTFSVIFEFEFELVSVPGSSILRIPGMLLVPVLLIYQSSCFVCSQRVKFHRNLLPPDRQTYRHTHTSVSECRRCSGTPIESKSLLSRQSKLRFHTLKAHQNHIFVLYTILSFLI